MDNQVIGCIIHFLERVQLEGKEVPAYCRCMEALYSKLEEAEPEA